MNTIAFIFARGGSTGILRKNLQEIDGVSLLGRAVNAAKELKSRGEVQRIVVSTDCEEIAAEAKRFGAEVPFMRPPELASSTASEWNAWQHAVGHESVGEFDRFISVPPTAPLRNVDDLRLCLARYSKGDVDVVVTGSRSARSPYFNMLESGVSGQLQLVKELPSAVSRRQDAPVTYDLTTVAYVTSQSYILNSEGVLKGRAGMVCVPTMRALDIDEPTDLEIARFLASRPELLEGECYEI